MPIPDHAQADIRAMGGGSRSGDGAPNGHNVNGALNVIERNAEYIHEYDLASYTDLPPDRLEEYKQAWEDLQHWGQLLANVFSKDVAGNDDGLEYTYEIEVEEENEDGEIVTTTEEETLIVENPHGPSDVGNDTADLPEPPKRGDSA